MRLHFLIPTLLVGAAALGGCAHDHSYVSSNDFDPMEPPETATITRYADENRDGVITRKEAKVDPALVASFDRYDLDDDNRLDRGEFARLEDASRREAASRHGKRTSDRWLSGDDGYFGPEHYRHSLNRSGGEQGRDQ